jgi:hypothetical protein
MKTSEFVQLLKNELILPLDPHLADRLAALLEENYEPIAPKESTPEDGVNIVPQKPIFPFGSKPSIAGLGIDISTQEPSESKPTPVESLPESTESEAK